MKIKKFNEYMEMRRSTVENFTPNTDNQSEPVESQSTYVKHTHDGKQISGFKEVVEIVGLGKMKAKLDTGNTAYSAIICQDFKEQDGKVTFEFNGEDRTYDVVKHIRIWHHGKSTERPVIRVDIKFNGKLYKDELVDLKISDLTGTKNYRTRMLICKDFMERANIVIDPSKEFKLTDKNDLSKKTKKKKTSKNK